MVELIIAIISGITSIATAVATAGVALPQSIESVHCVQRWHSDAGKLWNVQRHANSMLHAEITDLESAEAMLDSQVVNLQRQ